MTCTDTPLFHTPEDADLMNALPVLPVPASGSSPAIEALKAQKSANGFLIGYDGVHAFIRRPWITALLALTRPLPINRLYGKAGPADINLHCKIIPGQMLENIVSTFREALPNEAGAFIIWNEETRTFRTAYPKVISSTPSRLSYTPVELHAHEHLVADIHSHGISGPFWSTTDDADDAHQTALSIVVGNLSKDSLTGSYIARLCSRGVYFPLSKSPFSATDQTSSHLTFIPAKKQV